MTEVLELYIHLFRLLTSQKKKALPELVDPLGGTDLHPFL